MISDNREIVSKGKYDVFVVGGGIAGVSAAVTAGRLQELSQRAH